MLCRCLVQDQPHQDIPVIGHPRILTQGQDAALIKLHIAIHCQQQGQQVRKAEPAVNTAAYRGQVAQLHPDDVAQRLLKGTLCIGCKTGMLLQLPQGDHGANGELLRRLLDLIQPQGRQINGCAHRNIFHFEPDHSTQDPVRAFLVELPGLFQAFGPDILSDRNHLQSLSFFGGGRHSAAISFYFTTFFGIIHTKSILLPAICAG